VLRSRKGHTPRVSLTLRGLPGGAPPAKSMKPPFGLRRDDGHSRWVLAGHKNGRWARLSAARQRPLSVDHPRGLRRSMHTPMSSGTRSGAAMWSAAVDELFEPGSMNLAKQSSCKVAPRTIFMTSSSSSTLSARPRLEARESSLDNGRWRLLWIRCLAGIFLFDSSASWRIPHIVWTLATRRV
jgi:hypothetical protein